MIVNFLLFKLCENLVEFALYTFVETIGVVLKDEASDDVGVHLGLKLHIPVSSTRYHLPHFLNGVVRNGSGSDESPADDVFLLPIERYVRIGHELQDILAVFLQDQRYEAARKLGGVLSTGCFEELLLRFLGKHRILYRQPQLRHTDVTFSQRLHVAIDVGFEFLLGSALE